MVVQFHVRVMFAVFAVIQPTTGQEAPTWNTGTSFTKTSSDCTEITDLSATSQTGDTVLYSVVSQTPNAGFTIDTNFASDTILTCVKDSVSQSSYDVVVRAKYQSDAGQSDLTITITFTDQSSATGPTWNTGTSHTLDKTDANACDSVTTLSATSTDSSTVKYSIQGSSVFTITGNTLSCTLGDIILSSYTVVVRANQDNNVPTDITLTITVTGLSAPVFVDPDPDSTKDGHKIYMCENLQKGDAVMTLNANDEDSDDSSLIFSMDGSSDDVKALFEIDGNILKIKSTVADNTFDYEKEGSVKSYAIVLKVTDVSGLSSTLDTSIELEDDNEFAPVFTSASEASITESSSKGTTVIKLVASDQDGNTELNKVSFTLTGDDAASFEIGGSSNDEILVKEGTTFDYGTKSSYKLTVTASDSDPDVPKTTNQEITITILTAPVFNDLNVERSATVDDGAGTDATVYTINVSDEDNTGTLSISIVEQTPSEIFMLQDKVLKPKNTIEGDTGETTYKLKFKASDEKHEVTSAFLTVTINEVNDNAPKFENPDPTMEILENKEAGANVYEVKVTDADVGNPNDVFTFTMEETDTNHFVIGENDGVIKVNTGVTLDYSTKNEYKLVVTAKDTNDATAKSASTTVTVKIQTVPIFVDPDPDSTKDGHKIYMCENLQKGDAVMTLNANDEDSDDSSLIFSMDGSSDDVKALFEIVGNTLKIKSTVADNTFDYEKEGAVKSYTIVLKVTDVSGFSSLLETSIELEDDNEFAPVFTSASEASISESSSQGATVIKLVASDQDGNPEFNKVSFTLSGDDASSFELSESSKDEIIVKVGATFDYGTKSSYTLTVTASDSDPDEPKTADQELIIKILTAPSFTSPINNDKINVNEDSADGYLVKTLEASDKDGDPHTFTLVSQTPDDPVMFAVQNNELKTKGTFNVDVADAVQSYTLSLKVSDGNDKTDDETIQVEINIKDSNTQSPKFKTGVSYEASVKETAEIGFKVLTVTATDDDLTETYNKVTYSLGSVTEFIIGESSGEITVAAELSYNTKSSYDVTVTAKDNGGKSATQNVKITILTAPKFTSPINNDKIDVPEASADGSLVKTLVASDEDDDVPIYTIVSQTPDDPVKFVVENNELKTKGTFNVDVADAVQSYTLSLKVSDGNDKTDDETIQVEINIKDSNTQSPKFKTGVSYEASVQETAEIGFKVLTVTATDDDLTETNNKVTYSLGSVTEFKIGESSGEITVAAELNYDSKSSYDVTVTAKDNGDKSASQNLKITILAEPVFRNIAEAVTREIKENVRDGTSVFQVTVQDSDNTWDGVIEIASQPPGEMFKMDGDTLKTNTNSFDAETTTAYVVTFKVTDGDFIVTSEKLTINVLDVNDNKPSITAIEDITKPETLAVDEDVVDSIEATDKDISKPNNELVYAITSGNDGDIFKIEESSGKIQLNTQFSQSTYTLEVTVSDKGDPVLSATTEITINIDASTVDECADAPCQNGATCSSSVNKYSCQCVAGFEGKDCETNINECEPNPCLNEGSCTDGINMFTCDCAKGWGESTCSSACTGNKYGKNCAQNCNCNATRLIENVTDQQCDIKEGACKCNANFVNATCEDKDECTENPAICGGQLHVVCENTIGSYTCDCKQFYRKESNECKPYTEDKSVPIDQAKEIVVKANMAIGTADDCPPGLEKKTVYNEIKGKIENAVKDAHPASKSVHAFNIRCGSLKYELLIVVDKENAAQLSKELSSTSNQSITYDGKQLSVNQLEVNDVDVKRIHTDKEQTCAVFNTIEQCSGDYSCEIQNGLPTCQKNEKEDNMNLILGLGLGVCLPLLVMAFIAGACLYRQLRRSQIDEKRQENGYSNKAFRKELSPWRGRMKQNGFKLDTKDYANGYKYDNDRFHDSFSGNKHHYDMPGLSYTSI